MGYFLRTAYSDPQTIIEIDEARYQRLANARKTLVDAEAFEQRYELLLGNFTAFELFCARISLQGAIEHESRYGKWAEVFSEANRHTINFLTATRLFSEQVVRGFKHLALCEPFADSAKKSLTQAYDTTLGYRFVYELRNHMQHRATVVHGIEGRSEGAPWSESTKIYCQKERISEDRGSFKVHVLNQLENHIDLLSMFRAYMASVSRVQLELRQIISQACIDSRETIELAMEEYAFAQKGSKVARGRVSGLTAVKEGPANFRDVVPLILEWDDTRVAWGEKNSRAISPPALYVKP